MGTAKRERQKAGRQSRREEAVSTAKKQKSRKQLRLYGILAAVLIGLVALIWVLSDDGGNDSVATTRDSTGVSGEAPTTTVLTDYGTTPCPATDGTAERQTAFSDSFQQCIDPTKTYTAVIVTNKGELTVDLDATKAPITVNNFVSLARSKFYDAIPCHRIIPDFVAQCGDPNGDGSGGPGYKFRDELPAAGEYLVGSLAMANSGVDTNGSQFFIITGDRGAALDPNYSLFGQVRPGAEDVLAALDAAGSDENNGVPPKEPIGITSVTITES